MRVQQYQVDIGPGGSLAAAFAGTRDLLLLLLQREVGARRGGGRGRAGSVRAMAVGPRLPAAARLGLPAPSLDGLANLVLCITLTTDHRF